LNYSKKIRNYFEKYHLGVSAVVAIFSDSVLPGYDDYFPLCDSLFRYCITETAYIITLHNALRVFYGSYATSEDGLESKKRWIANPNLFIDQVKLKFGKPGVLSLERYEQVVASNFETLMKDLEKKTSGVFTIQDNAVLIRYRVLCFAQAKRLNSTKTNRANKTKRKSGVVSSTPSSISNATPATSARLKDPPQPTTQTNLSVSTPLPSARRKDSPGFLNLLHTCAERKLPTTPEPSQRKLGLETFISGGRTQATMMRPQESTNRTVPLNPTPTDVDNTIAIEADPGPFKLATADRLEAFGPVLAILPDSGDIHVVLVELSPLDVYYTERLRLDPHSMTYLSSIPSFKEMRLRGYSFQFYSSKKDFVSDSFAILRGASNEIVGTIMDEVMPRSHSYSAQFKLLAHHGDYQPNRDAGNKAGRWQRVPYRPWCV
jgi:hypothetical protein